jgi:transcriptional regulator with XRE-family HTH domain
MWNRMGTSKELAKEIGSKMAAARKESGLSRAEVGRKLGLSEKGYGHIEAGRRMLVIEHLLKLPDILNKPITYFLPDAVVSEEERHDPLLDPRLQAVIAAWPDAPEYLKDLVTDVLQRAVGEK